VLPWEALFQGPNHHRRGDLKLSPPARKEVKRLTTVLGTLLVGYAALARAAGSSEALCNVVAPITTDLDESKQRKVSRAMRKHAWDIKAALVLQLSAIQRTVSERDAVIRSELKLGSGKKSESPMSSWRSSTGSKSATNVQQRSSFCKRPATLATRVEA